jgi:hypothetical protein
MTTERKPHGYYTDKLFTPADMDKAIAAERKALAAQPADPTGQAPCARHCEATAFQIVIKNLRGDIERLKAPQRTEQEPVAWLDPWTRNNVTTDYDAYGNNGIPLYATPPQRKPLTDEQIFALENSIPDEVVSDRDWCIHFARAIEAKLKENT